MKKPHTHKNKKRNIRRKRTNSDPSHSSTSVKENASRNRSTSESSEDYHPELLNASSEEDFHDQVHEEENVEENETNDALKFESQQVSKLFILFIEINFYCLNKEG